LNKQGAAALPFQGSRLKRLLCICLCSVVTVCATRLIPFFSPVLSSTIFRTVVSVRTAIGMKNKIVAGKDGWLFYEPELTYATRPLPAENVERIAFFDRTLREHGMILFVVPIPNKIDIYPEKFTDIPAPSPVKAARREIVSGLEKAGVRVIDLVPPFMEAKKNGTPVFDAFESHWTALGMEVAGRCIAGRVAPAAFALRGGPPVLYGVNDTILKGRGDLLGRICGNERWTWYPLPVRRVLCPDGSLYSDDRTSKIMVLGDSYVNHGKWWNAHLGAQIARFLGTPTRTYFSLLANTEGPCMYRLKPRMFPGSGGVVIWAFSSRVLQYHLGDPTKGKAEASDEIQENVH
jgi:hypothetical protein